MSKTDQTHRLKDILTFTTSAACRANLSHTGGVGMGQNTKTALKVHVRRQMSQKCNHVHIVQGSLEHIATHAAGSSFSVFFEQTDGLTQEETSLETITAMLRMAGVRATSHCPSNTRHYNSFIPKMP